MIVSHLMLIRDDCNPIAFIQSQALLKFNEKPYPRINIFNLHNYPCYGVHLIITIPHHSNQQLSTKKNLQKKSVDTYDLLQPSNQVHQNKQTTFEKLVERFSYMDLSPITNESLGLNSLGLANTF